MTSPTWFLLFSVVVLLVGCVFLFRWLRKFTDQRFDSLIRKVFEGDQPPHRVIEQDMLGLPWMRGTESSVRMEWILFLGAGLLYLGTRLIGLEHYPSFFYADEAAHAVFAEEMVEKGWVYEGEFLPTYFYNVDKYSLSVSVYLHCLPALFGVKAVVITRLVAVLITLVGVGAIGFTLRRIYRTPYWWAGILLLSIQPVWLLHSRTAFEIAAAVSFFAMFFCAYHLYLYVSPKYVYPTWLFAALTFYTYNPGRVVIAVTIFLLLLSDFRVHWQNRRSILRSLWFAVLLVLPYLRFQRTHFLSEIDQLELLKSYWVEPLPLLDKLSRFAGEMMRGLNPGYWFLPNQEQLVWTPIAPFRLTQYGQIHWVLLPFVIAGLVLALRRLKCASFRNILLILIAAPVGASLVQVNATRALFMILPVTLLAGLGLSWILGQLESITSREALNLAVVIASSVLSLGITRNALLHVPDWPEEVRPRNNSSAAVKVYAEIDRLTEVSPERAIIVSPYWAYATSFHARFFANTIDNLSFGRIDEYLQSGLSINEGMIFVMLADEYERMLLNEAVESSHIIKIVGCDDVLPCFYFASVLKREPASRDKVPLDFTDRTSAIRDMTRAQ